MIYTVKNKGTGKSHSFGTKEMARAYIEENLGCFMTPTQLGIHIKDRKNYFTNLSASFPLAWKKFVKHFEGSFPEIYHHSDCWVEEITFDCLMEFYYTQNITSHDRENNAKTIATCFKICNRNLEAK